MSKKTPDLRQHFDHVYNATQPTHPPNMKELYEKYKTVEKLLQHASKIPNEDVPTWWYFELTEEGERSLVREAARASELSDRYPTLVLAAKNLLGLAYARRTPALALSEDIRKALAEEAVGHG